MRKSLEDVLTEVRTVPHSEIPKLLGDLEFIKSVAFTRLIEPPPARAPDELLDVNETAKRLHVSPAYLYQNHGKFSFVRRVGNKLLFSANGLDSYLKHKSR